MQYIALLKLVLSLLPLLVDTIKAVEAAIPDTGKGSEKLALIRAVVENAYKGAIDVTASFEALWPTLSGTVSAIVAAFNATGVFKK